ncbi:MAG: hypothetical protein N3A56_03370 [Thermodesulfobacteriaceae bacterium]|nr:hypothetical protein [Thermodesulfobacteriaceae bacterium]
MIAIIAILASIAIPQYLKYQRKSKVSSYALPAVRACAMDVVSWCVENPGSSVTYNATNTPNCNGSSVTINTAGGPVTITTQSVSCTANGSISGSPTIATGNLSGVDDYQARCLFANESLRCTVEGR